MEGLNLFAQIRKVDEEWRLVYGRLTQEVSDKAGECMDYDLSKPNFEKWIADSMELSKGKGHGNMRAMHGNVCARLFPEVILNDDEKAEDVVGRVIDDNEWEKVLAGAYPGFSVGGAYGKKWQDGDVLRYEAIPKEGSLVDRPCVLTATFFEVLKQDDTLAKELILIRTCFCVS